MKNNMWNNVLVDNIEAYRNNGKKYKRGNDGICS